MATISPKKYSPPRPTDDDCNGRLRRSKRLASALGLEPQPVEKKQKRDDNERFAVVPKFADPENTEDRKVLEDLLIDPEQAAQLDEDSVKAYLAAAGSKLGADEHSSLVHLAQSGYDLKLAMESIDSPDSLPRATINGDHGTGIWTAKELKTLSTQLNKENNAKKMKTLKKLLPAKKVTNIVNAYYNLKKYRCNNESKSYFCNFKLQIAKTELGYDYVKSADCANCRDQLWMEADSENLDVDLCALCALYHINFRTMRPNAAVTEEVFDFGLLPNECQCQIEMREANEECLASLRKCAGKDVITVNGTHLAHLGQQLVGMSVSSAVMQLMDPKVIQYDHNYIFVCHNGIASLAEFERLDLNLSSDDASTSGSMSSNDSIISSSSTNSEECSKPEMSDEDKLRAKMRETLANLKNMPSDMRHCALVCMSLFDPEFLRQAYNAELAKSKRSEPDCMLYGTVNEIGKITPASDAKFAEYYEEILKNLEPTPSESTSDDSDSTATSKKAPKKTPKRQPARRGKRSQ
uniref:ELM2 domain-containing protein n=1 Tax=Panagrellus redivivus TaxID=6233 RepID=A0A7E4VDP8_PANRE